MGQPCIIVDMDGTLSDPSHRLHHIKQKPKNWKAFADGAKDDPPNKPILSLVLRLQESSRIVVCSGRHDEYDNDTRLWLRRYGVRFESLYMRQRSDYRADDVVKEQLLEQIYRDGWDPWLVIDDRQRVVDMWRRNGLTCLQCAPGDF